VKLGGKREEGRVAATDSFPFGFPDPSGPSWRGAWRGDGEGARGKGREARGGSAHRLGQIVRLMGFRVTRKRRFNDQLSLSFCRSRCPPCRGYPVVSAGLTAGQHDGSEREGEGGEVGRTGRVPATEIIPAFA